MQFISTFMPTVLRFDNYILISHIKIPNIVGNMQNNINIRCDWGACRKSYWSNTLCKKT